MSICARTCLEDALAARKTPLNEKNLNLFFMTSRVVKNNIFLNSKKHLVEENIEQEMKHELLD